MTREPEIERLYVDTGKVRYVSKNFPFLGPESFLAAEAAEEAAAQGKYWEFRRLVFSRQRGENRGAFSVENLKNMASELKLDRAAFDRTLDGRLYKEKIEAEAQEAKAAGVGATPTFFIGERKVEGAPSLERMKQMIDEELARK